MVFNALNTVKARVYDVDTKTEILKVLEVNTITNTIKTFEITFDDQIIEKVRKFRSIYPIYGECAFPQLFHCYGRIHED